jgi:hypothetical protein
VHFYGAGDVCVFCIEIIATNARGTDAAFHLISSSLSLYYYLLCVCSSVEWRSRWNSWYCISQLQFMDWKRVVIEEFSRPTLFLNWRLDIFACYREEMMEMWFYCTPSWIGWFYSPQKTPLGTTGTKI